MLSPPLLVFDLDGTLVDTAPDLIDTLNVVFERESLPPIPYESARKLIGGGVKAMIVRGLEAERRAVVADEVERMFADFIQHYSAHIADRSRPFPGLEAALDVLAERRHRLAVCTNKLEHLSLLLLRSLGLAERFAAICGQDTFGVMKPDPAMLYQTIAAAGGERSNAVMIGDSVTDIRTARAARIPVIAVEFGYSEKAVAEYDPDYLIDTFDRLPAAVLDLSRRRINPT
ncbi:MAG TPA: HAD-IA family hydrolase [Pseudolabrys sp.]|nr:HAD-IA family hydrolase [Pseudolabrys sp.]